jgi:hypothetical protein
MKNFIFLFIVLCLALLLTGNNANAKNPKIRIVEVSAEKIDILVDGKLFTSYQYGLNKEKPIFFPVNSPQGNMINRGWPMMENVPEEANEKKDHIHHQSLSYTYGDVNGLDFWAEPSNPAKNGKIIHRKLMRKAEKGNQAEIELLADWVAPNGKVLLNENKVVKFTARKNYYAMDFDIKLTAQDTIVRFGDTKEGMFAIRLTPTLNDSREDAEYLNNDGLRGEKEVWGKRSNWIALTGPVKNESVVVGIFIHPTSQNFPPYWHARSYGLFAVNPFGRKMYTNNIESPLEITLQPGESFPFKARVMIYSGKMSPEELAKEYDNYKK